MCVPEFSSTGTVVLVNLRTLECTPLTFAGAVAGGLAEGEDGGMDTHGG